MNKVKILFMAPLPPPIGGISKIAETISKKSVSHIDENIEIVILDTERGSKKINNNRLIKLIIRSAFVLKDLLYNILFNKIDIVHLNTSLSNKAYLKDFFIVLLIKLFNKKIVIQYHCDVEVYALRRKKLGQIITKMMFKLASHNIVLNRKSKLFIEKYIDKECIIVGNFISDLYLSNSNIKKDIRKMTISYSGHIGYHKGSDILLDIAREYNEINFKFIGRIMDDFKDKIINQPNNIIFTGELKSESVKEELIKSDVFIFPSLAEGFPLAIIEAMSCELPIISSAVGAIPDIIDEKGGVLLNNISKAEIKEKLDIMINKDKKQLEEMGRHNRKKILENYTYENVLADYIKIYRNCNNI